MRTEAHTDGKQLCGLGRGGGRWAKKPRRELGDREGREKGGTGQLTSHRKISVTVPSLLQKQKGLMWAFKVPLCADGQQPPDESCL